jgi:D-galactonate transporter
MMATTNPAVVPEATSASDRLYRKVGWRLMPLLIVCYLAAYLDRVNIGFAKLQMQSALGLSESVYGLGAGVFFIGYFTLEVPSNLALHKFGARKWIARIMMTWGALSVAMMFTRSPVSFYAIRFFLGAAEAGFFPGIILYLSYWYPDERRGRATSLFISAIPISGIIGGPLSGAILHGMDGVKGLAGWQWLFLLEGLPAILLGFVILVWLDDRVHQARWLTDSEREHIARDIAADKATHEETSTSQVLRQPWIWLFAFADFCFVSGLYGVSFWLPSLIKALGVADPLDVGLISTIPWTFGIIAMYLTARSADRRSERRWHTAIAGLVGALGFVISVAFHAQPVWSMFGLTLAMMGIMANVAVFWAIPPAILRGTAAAVGIALINSFGNLSGFTAPYMIGIVKDLTHSTDAAIYVLAALLVVGVVIVLTLKVLKVRPRAAVASP